MEETRYGCDNVIANILCCEQLQPCSPSTNAKQATGCSIFVAQDSSATINKPLFPLDGRFPVAYAYQVFLWKKNLEGSYHPLGCLNSQPEVTADMRQKLIQWLTQVNRQFDYTLETLCLTVNYIDRFLAITPVKPASLQLIGVAALLVAAKKEEVYPPELNEIARLCGGAYEKSHIRQMEVLLLTALGFGLCAPTASYFLEYYSFCANNYGVSFSCDAAKELVEASLSNYALCQYRPSVIAAAAVILTQDLIHSAIFFPEAFPRCELEDLDMCILRMSSLIQNWHQSILSISRHFLTNSSDNRLPNETAVDEARKNLSRALSTSMPHSLVLH